MSNTKDMAIEILKRIDEEPQHLEAVKLAFNSYIDGVLLRTKDLIEDIEYKDIGGIMAHIIDMKTNTGLAEPIDGPLIKMLADFIIKKYIPETKYNKTVKQITDTIDNIGGTV